MILALISDLFFVTRVQEAAKAAGFEFMALSEYKPAKEFLEILQRKNPQLIMLDLNSALPWAEWLPAAKAEKQSKRIPWLAFGSHMNPRRLAAARHAGVDKVVPKSLFAEELQKMLKLVKNG